ncbi:MAG: alpha/beta fold hydrolase [Idiomarina sp.]|nr:alpha/beta fold hydrolase [Idiomarina sp.]
MSESSKKTLGIVVLVHGFNKKARDMRYLKAQLTQAGWTCVAANLPTLFGDMNACVHALHQQMRLVMNDKRYASLLDLPVHFVCHSMGGLITRQFIHRYWRQSTQRLTFAAPHRAINIGHCVFIATPHRGSRLADYALRIPGYRRAFKPISALLPEAGYQPLPVQRDFKLGLIAGNQSGGLFGRLLSGPNDGHVEVASVDADDADELVELPFDHKHIHKQPATSALIHAFLIAGKFP